MKKNNSLLLLLVFTGIFVACNKEVTPWVNDSPARVTPTVPIANREFLWQCPWYQWGNGYQIVYASDKITTDQIAKGLEVRVAILAEDTPWELLPAIIGYLGRDTVHMRFQLVPGYLTIIAQTNFDLSNSRADVQIDYK